MKKNALPWIIMLLVILALISLGLGIYLYVTRPQTVDYLSLDNGPMNVPQMLEPPVHYSDSIAPLSITDTSLPDKILQKVLGPSPIIGINDSGDGVDIETNTPVEWDVSFDVQPTEGEFGFTTKWTLNL